MHEKKIKNIIELNNSERYDYLIRKVADFESIFLIYRKYWGVSKTNFNEIKCVLVFPEKTFAERHIKSERFKRIKKKNLYKFLNWLEKDKSKKLNFAIFPNQENEARIVKSPEFKNDLLKECEQYE